MIKNKYPLVRQNDLKDCGVCSLLMIIKYYHGYVDLEVLRQMTHTSKRGVSAYHLINTAKELGFNAYGIKSSIEEYSKNILPIIAYIKTKNNLFHYVVIYKINKRAKNLLIADPAYGLKKYSFSEFQQIFQNVLIVLYPVNNITNIASEKHLLNFCILFFQKYHNSYLKYFLISLLIGLFSIFTGFYLEWIMHGINNNMEISYFYAVLFTYIILYFVYYLITYFQKKFFLHINEKFNYTFTTTFINHILFLPYQYYYSRTPGEIIQKINDLNYIELFISKIMIFFSFDLWLLISCFIFLTCIKKLLFIVLTCYLFLELFINNYFEKKYYSNHFLLQQKKEYVVNLISQMIYGFESIKGNNLETNINSNFKYQYLLLLKQDIKYNLLLFIHEFLKDNFRMFIFIITIFIYVVTNLKSSNVIINIFTIQLFLNYFMQSISTLEEVLIEYPKAKQVYNRISFILEGYEEENNNKSFIDGSITINNLTYLSDDTNELFNNLSLKIHNGEKILLLGPTGSGKSTLFKILLKYYDVDSNHVFLNNTDINLISEKVIHNNIICVNQNGVLFSDTLYQNIVFHRNISNNELSEIINICNIDEIISKRNLGYQTMIEENGFNLSGGEKSRIMLARSLVSKFQILLIDECFSSMNEEMEYSILKKLFYKYYDKTIIVISHRKTSIELFDKSYYLNKGKLIEL